MKAKPKIRLLIVDDHPVVLEGLDAILKLGTGLKVVATAHDGQTAVAEFRRCKPDVTLMDLRMPRMDGLSATREIRKIDPKARVIILTTYDDEHDINQALKAGASAYLLKDSSREKLTDCIYMVYEGKIVIGPRIAAKVFSNIHSPELTQRELGVLRAMATGLTNKEIGTAMGITEGTVKSHINRIFRKLGVVSRTAATRLALERGLVTLDRSLPLPTDSK